MEELFKQTLSKAFKLKDQGLQKPIPHAQLAETFDLSLDDKVNSEQLAKVVDQIFKYSVNTQSPHFLNQLYGGSTQEAWLGELLVAILNTSMATYEIAPLATLMEKEIIAQVNKQIGFKHVEGLFTPGGSYANMLGIHCARHFHLPETKNVGLREIPPCKIFVSSDAHYSSKKAMNLMGFGEESLVLVKTSPNHKMDVNDLKDKIKQCKSEGSIPLCVVSTAGTTVWGAFDPIQEIQVVCQEENIWHHVDAAWGGLALWSDNKSNQLFEGVEKIDSITIDFHKLFASTVTKGLFLTSHKNILRKANSGGGDKYIFHDEEAIDTGLYSLQCGRRANSLPVWLQWKSRGTDQFKQKINHLEGISEWLVNFFENNQKDFKLLHSPEYMNFCFQVIPQTSETNINKYNRELREKLMERGNFMVNFAKDEKNGTFFRLVLNHWELEQHGLEKFFQELQSIRD
ncbi:pyridoxal-dependent decarboxylase [Bacteriovoracaceae bacterium]|nr:pyridoxal-dependent decarboxylase [Bacteriovoracaceae bacterium]